MTPPKTNATWTPEVFEDIHVKAQLGRYRIRGFGADVRVPNFDDLTILSTGMTRFPLEGYREKCNLKSVLGAKRAEHPIEIDIPIYITGMSYGALSANAKEALGRGASRMGTATCTGEGGMHPLEREHSSKLIYQMTPSRYGFNPHHMRVADAIEIVVGQGAKPGTGGLLLGMKVRDDVAEMRKLPAGVDQRSPTRHPDWLGVDDLSIKIEQVRQATDGKIPVFVKMAASRVNADVKMAAKIGADVIVVDGMVAGTGASPDILLNHSSIPTMPAVVQARRALEEVDEYGKISLVVSGGIRTGADVAKAIALGADAVAIGAAALAALNCNKDIAEADFEGEIGVPAGHCHHCHTGRCPVGITTQDPQLMDRLEPQAAAKRVANYLNAIAMEAAMFARSCGKSDVHHLEPEDLAALTVEASGMAQVPLAGTDKVY